MGQPERVADELIARISSGTYPLGTKLPPERALATEFSVSRPVIREALRMLAMLQLVDIQVGRGAFVSALPDVADAASLDHVDDLGDIIDVREVLEIGALRLAGIKADDAARRRVADTLSALEAAVAAGETTTQLDRRLHDAIISAAASPMLLRIWRSIDSSVAKTIRVSPHGRLMSKALLSEHKLLAQGVIDLNIDAAIEASKRLHEDNRRFLAELADPSETRPAA